MRLWSLHPRYLDSKGLTACWREGLLAQAVLAGRTRGYTRHPQLERFRRHADPLGAIGAYLRGIADEADRRGYRFDRSRIIAFPPEGVSLTVTRGQLEYEFARLRRKLELRAPEKARELEGEKEKETHPLFRVVEGGVEEWEKVREV